jgi:hypothetical protein
MRTPYTSLEPNRFWRTGVSETHPLTAKNLYTKKFPISHTDRIATAGSCFAQHVTNQLRAKGFSVMDVEPRPPFLQDDVAKEFGYGIYSARYGNIYTVRQLLQLARDADTGAVDALNVWTRDGRFFDALRPNTEPKGYDSVEEALALRRDHLKKVRQLFAAMDVFIFTLGLTEAWVDVRTGTVFPTAPGTIAGDFDPEFYAFKNFGFAEIHDDFMEFHSLVTTWNPALRIILTVSPVPLTATATDNHVLIATTYSKSVLRAVAGSLADANPTIDYFPSYEMIASPWSKGFFYDANMRSVNSGGVAVVMRVFFEQHGKGAASIDDADQRRRIREERMRRRELRNAQQQQEQETGDGTAPGDGPGDGDGAATGAAVAEAKGDEAKGDEAVCEDILLEAFAP